jgi:HK97 family phage major capsid protein
MKFLEMLQRKRSEMAEQRSALVAQMEAATEGAEAEQRSELNELEAAAFTEARGKVAEIDEALVGINAQIAELETVAEGARSYDAPQVMRKVEVQPAAEVRSLTRGEVRDQSLALLERRSTEYGTDAPNTDRLDGLMRSERTRNFDGHAIAQRLLVTESDDYRSAWMKAVTQAQPVFSPEEARALNAYSELRAMSIGTDASGGFGVPVLIDPTIVLTSQGSLNPIEALARVETITTDVWKGVSSTGVSWSFDAEAAAVSDDSPTLAQPEVTAYAARGFIPYSIEVGQDYPGFAAEMSALLNSGYAELKAQKFAVGTGSGEPFGIFVALDANTNVEVVVTTDGSFGGVDVNKVWGALPDRYKGNATWLMSHDVGNEVSTFGNGDNFGFSTVDLTGQVQTIRQRPVAFASYAPDFTGATTAANILVVGDFSNYLIAQRAGMEVELVPHLFDVTNNRPTGQRGWFAHARVGADSINDLGFRLLQNQ